MAEDGKGLEHQFVRGADWRNADLRGACLRGARLQDADLRGADLRGADLRGVVAMWSSVLLDEADLQGCDLRDADFSGVHAPGVRLADANLEGSRWDGAYLTCADLSRARMGWQSTFVANLATHRNARNAASFDDAVLADCDLRRAQLPGASFRRADLSGASGAGSVLTDADLREANLSRTDLRSADLCGADLTGSLLRHADLAAAALVETQFRNAEVAGIQVTGARIGSTGFAVRRTPATEARSAGPDLSQCVRLAPDYGCATGRSALVVIDDRVSWAGRQVVAAVQKDGILPFSLLASAIPAELPATFLARAAAANDVTIALHATGSVADWVHFLRRRAVESPRWSRQSFAFIEVPVTGDLRPRVTLNRHEAAGADLAWLDELSPALAADVAERALPMEVTVR
jgi:uncharacterized protein YjbI with pentapeptide repeats